MVLTAVLVVVLDTDIQVLGMLEPLELAHQDRATQAIHQQQQTLLAEHLALAVVVVQVLQVVKAAPILVVQAEQELRQ